MDMALLMESDSWKPLSEKPREQSYAEHVNRLRHRLFRSCGIAIPTEYLNRESSDSGVGARAEHHTRRKDL